MIRNVIGVFLPLTYKGSDERQNFTIASYDYDIGLQENELFQVVDASFYRTLEGKSVKGAGPRFTFQAKVLKRLKVIQQGEPDQLTIAIQAEIADKELIPDIVKDLKSSFPDSYDDFQGSVIG
jgi:hypothetical protein